MSTGLLVAGVGAVPLIVGLVEVFKGQGLPSKRAPLAALILGLAFGLLAASVEHSVTLLQGSVYGIIAGLAASGAYSGGKAVMAKDTEPQPHS